jgi:hypothetical protein
VNQKLRVVPNCSSEPREATFFSFELSLFRRITFQNQSRTTSPDSALFSIAPQILSDSFPDSA